MSLAPSTPLASASFTAPNVSPPISLAASMAAETASFVAWTVSPPTVVTAWIEPSLLLQQLRQYLILILLHY